MISTPPRRVIALAVFVPYGLSLPFIPVLLEPKSPVLPAHLFLALFDGCTEVSRTRLTSAESGQPIEGGEPAKLSLPRRFIAARLNLDAIHDMNLSTSEFQQGKQ